MQTDFRSTREALTFEQRQLRTRGLLAAAALSTAAAWPVAHAEDGPVLCPFRLVTGLPCPLCGMTRSFIYTLHGDLPAAFSAHLFGPALVVLATLWVVVWVRPRMSDRAVGWSDPSRWFHGRARVLTWTLLALWVGYAGLRWAQPVG